MADATIKHFIFIRFFNAQDPKYPHDIYDVDFLSKQLILIQNNALKSLENQTNKNFELVFIVNSKFLDDPKYDFIFSTLRNATTLPLNFISKNECSRLVKEALNECDFVIESRMDFDDFIFKDVIADTQSKIHDCNSILAYGYCLGYVYIDGELYTRKYRYKGIGHIAILQSLILKSSFAKNLPFIGIHAKFSHIRIKEGIKSFLEENNMEFSESMFQQNTSTKAYIYFRHEFSHSRLTRSDNSKVNVPKAKPKPVTNKNDITKKQLEEEFAFFYDLKSIK